jgi:phosphoribosylformylglycinamidine synthase
LTTFEGAPQGPNSTNGPINALSDFRAAQLLPRIQAIEPKITSLQARFIHLVATEQIPSEAAVKQLAELLNYGQPAEPVTGKPADSAVFIVSPRVGTVSPWASKATDIARNCGLAVKRIERITEFRVHFKHGLFGKTVLDAAQSSQIAALLHDRMTESLLADRAQAEQLFTELQGADLQTIDVLQGGKAALVAANSEFGLALAPDEIDYLVDAFTKLKRRLHRRRRGARHQFVRHDSQY